MVLEMLTLVILVAVVVVKYGTTAHVQKLNQRQLELQNVSQQLNGRLNVLKKQCNALDAEERELQPVLRSLQGQLEELSENLKEQEERNDELKERVS